MWYGHHSHSLPRKSTLVPCSKALCKCHKRLNCCPLFPALLHPRPLDVTLALSRPQAPILNPTQALSPHLGTTSLLGAPTNGVLAELQKEPPESLPPSTLAHLWPLPNTTDSVTLEDLGQATALPAHTFPSPTSPEETPVLEGNGGALVMDTSPLPAAPLAAPSVRTHPPGWPVSQP